MLYNCHVTCQNHTINSETCAPLTKSVYIAVSWGIRLIVQRNVLMLHKVPQLNTLETQFKIKQTLNTTILMENCFVPFYISNNVSSQILHHVWSFSKHQVVFVLWNNQRTLETVEKEGLNCHRVCRWKQSLSLAPHESPRRERTKVRCSSAALGLITAVSTNANVLAIKSSSMKARVHSKW